MTLQLSCCSMLRQELRLNLAQQIELSNLMAFPDEALSLVLSSLAISPEKFEPLLRENSERIESKLAKIRARLAPNINSLDSGISDASVAVTRDVTYIGRERNKPKIIFSDHLQGSLSLSAIQVPSSEYPEVAKLLVKLRRFDEWKRETLRVIYPIFGEVQQSYFTRLDRAELVPFSQDDLANKLDIHPSTISRILTNRVAEVNSIDDKTEIVDVKFFCVSQYQMIKYQILPRLNEILAQEFDERDGYSDEKIVSFLRKVSLARRTVSKYREEYRIPNHRERKEQYLTGKRTEPYVFN